MGKRSALCLASDRRGQRVVLLTANRRVNRLLQTKRDVSRFTMRDTSLSSGRRR